MNDQPATIALFLPNWIGDVVMATPAIRSVRERFPQARLLAVCKPYVAATLSGNSWFDDVILMDKSTLRKQVAVIKQLRREKVDAAILFPNSFRSGMVAWLGGCRRRIGFNRYGRGLLLSDRLRPKRVDGKLVPSPVIDDYNRLVAPLGITDPGYRLELFTTPTEDEAAEAIWREFKLDRFPEVIGLNSSGAFGAAKLWPNEHFASLARELIDRRGAGILVLCGPNEREIAREIVRLTDRPDQIVSLADSNVSLGLTKACVKKLDLLVTTDSGPRHFAQAFARPVVCLFGPTFIEWTETYYDQAINLQKKVPCGPCQQRVCPLDHRCMKELMPLEVLSASEDLLDRQEGRLRLAS
jgi:heptosyltransferase-2